MKKLIFILAGAAMLTACNGGGQKSDLQAQNDSLVLALSQRNAELDEIMGAFNDVQDGIRRITDAENRVDLQRGNITEDSQDAKDKLISDIEFIRQQMEDNKAQISRLQSLLKNSQTQSAQLKKAVEKLTKELAEKQQRIEDLQAELAQKNIRIQELDEAVSALTADNESLTESNEAKAKTVDAQDKTINTAWFVFGTQIDIRTTKEIPLYAKSAEILTSHPAGTYELVKDSKKELTLKITNPTEFWSVSKYLVIQVK
jgi:DNA repair exonuclease SbcCD ATPase subunit